MRGVLVFFAGAEPLSAPTKPAAGAGGYHPPDWLAIGLGIAVVAAMVVASLWIAEAFELLGFGNG